MSAPAATRLRVLVVLAQPPLLEGNAPGKHAVALLRGLVEHGIDVRAVAARQYFAESGEPPDDLPVEVVEVSAPLRSVASQLMRFRRPRGELAGAFAHEVRLRAGDVDLVHLEETATAWCDLGLNVPSLVHVHYRVRRDRSLGKPWRHEFRYVLEQAAAERLAIRRHQFLVANSPEVASSIRKVSPHSDVVVAPLALDPGPYVPAPLQGAPIAGIIGTAAWAPTGESMTRLVDRIWPQLHVRVPEARLRVAGWGTRGLALGHHPTIEVLGEVQSAPAFLRDLSMLLYPVSRGSGMKVKVLEAMAVGLPVVTTPCGAEGVEPCAGVIVAESDSEIVAVAARLFRDASERRERGEHARAAFLERYTPRPATAPLVELYRRMAGH